MLMISVPEAFSNIHSRDLVTTICHSVLFIVHTTPTDFSLCIMLLISVPRAVSNIHSRDLVTAICHTVLFIVHTTPIDFCYVSYW